MASNSLAASNSKTGDWENSDTTSRETNVTSPWQAFQIYLMEKIAAVRHFTFAARRPTQDGSQAASNQGADEYEREHAEYMYLYAEHDVAATPVIKLPQEILLKIFSLLDCRDLCSCAQVCRLWRKVSEDPLMWSVRLVEDSRRWPFISSHTFIDKELTAKAPAKLAYLRCSPDFGGSSASPGVSRRRLAGTGTTLGTVGGVSSHMSNLWRSWFPRKNPRFLLCEGDTRLRFMRRILHDKFNAFVPVSMFSTDWFLNAGLTYQMTVDGRDLLFDLVTFGSNPRVEAELFEVLPPAPTEPVGSDQIEEAPDDQQHGAAPLDNIGEPRLRLGEDFRRYTHMIDGLIFIINAESGAEDFKRRRAEYRAYVDSLADRPTVPILFLSLVVEDESARRYSCVEMARHLGLISLRNPWIICDGRSKGLHRVSDGFLWLVQRAT